MRIKSIKTSSDYGDRYNLDTSLLVKGHLYYQPCELLQALGLSPELWCLAQNIQSQEFEVYCYN